MTLVAAGKTLAPFIGDARREEGSFTYFPGAIFAILLTPALVLFGGLVPVLFIRASGEV